MTRRSWITAVSVAALARSQDQRPAEGCSKTNQASADYFPKVLRPYYVGSLSGPLFNLPGYDDLPSAVITPARTVRIAVDQMGRPENAPALNLLRTAYQLMRADIGQTGFALQASLHMLYCNGGGAHRSTDGIFLAWHRAFLYFHERMLRWKLERAGVSGAAAVQVPYWDVLSFGESGGIYNSCPELDYRNCRTWISPDSPTSTQAVGQLRRGLNDADPMTCAMDMFSWHLAVHGYVGGEMKTLARAAFDPIFYALHSSVDRMWTISNCANVPLNSNTCAFYDPYAGAWVKVDLKNVGSVANVGVTYAPPGGAAAWLLTMPVPAAVGIQLPDKITEGSALEVRLPGTDQHFDIGVVTLSSDHHSNHEMPSRFAILPELERKLKRARHDAVQFSLRGPRGERTVIDKDWRLLASR